MAWEHAIKFAQGFLGEDRVMYAMDYPYQYAPDEVNILDAMDMPLDVKKQVLPDQCRGRVQDSLRRPRFKKTTRRPP